MAAMHPIDGEKTLREPAPREPLMPAMTPALDHLDLEALRRDYREQGAFLYLPDFLAPAMTQRLVAAVAAAEGAVNRNYLPGHKQGGSVSRHAIDELYFYTRAGDHIGWHYDTSYYAGRRYTLLIGLIDDSSCRLDYELHTRETDARAVPGSVRIPPGGLVFFDGDKLRHRITPLKEGERRVSLTFEYVTDPNMHLGWRLISNMKDAVAYFGFSQVFRRRSKKRSSAGLP
jgi:hypothetical protein